MTNYMFYRNLANGCPFTILQFNATKYYNTYKDTLKCYSVKQNWSEGSIKNNAILFLKNKPLSTCVDINDFIYIKFEEGVVQINLSL